MSTTLLKLIYFDIHGLGARIRLAARVGGLPLEDFRFPSRDVFTAMKLSGELPFGQVPLLVVGGGEGDGGCTKIAQSSAILRYVCSLSGLHPTGNLLSSARIDAALAAEDDAFSPLRAVRYAARNGLGCLDEPALFTVMTAQLNEVVPRHLCNLEKVLSGSMSGWIADTPEPSAADFAWGTHLRDISVGGDTALPPSLIVDGPYPIIRVFLEKFLALPEVAKYYGEFPGLF